MLYFSVTRKAPAFRARFCSGRRVHLQPELSRKPEGERVIKSALLKARAGKELGAQARVRSAARRLGSYPPLSWAPYSSSCNFAFRQPPSTAHSGNLPKPPDQKLQVYWSPTANAQPVTTRSIELC